MHLNGSKISKIDRNSFWQRQAFVFSGNVPLKLSNEYLKNQPNDLCCDNICQKYHYVSRTGPFLVFMCLLNSLMSILRTKQMIFAAIIFV